MKRKIAIALAITAYLSVMFFAYLKLSNFFEIDSCLDKGGRWSYERNECELSTFD
jgi:hypothetical protein